MKSDTELEAGDWPPWQQVADHPDSIPATRFDSCAFVFGFPDPQPVWRRSGNGSHEHKGSVLVSGKRSKAGSVESIIGRWLMAGVVVGICRGGRAIIRRCCVVLPWMAFLNGQLLFGIADVTGQGFRPARLFDAAHDFVSHQ